MASCVSNLLMTAVLGSPEICEWLPWLAAFPTYSRRFSSALQLEVSGCRDSLHFQPTDDGCSRLTSKAHLTSLKAVILIFKRATFLRLEGLSPEPALTQAELDYRQANIDFNIRQHLTGSSQDPVELSASFLMTIDIGSFTLASVNLISSRF
ncbi:hypothetical protein EDB84DRAFT_1579919 [Lactarius hengduanensis]|nr:hypothetical protein EDB84DRAFT_1579919 [Lactarius hengduanensis]